MKKTNKIISALLVLVMMLTMAPLTAFAATEAFVLEKNYIDYEINYSDKVTQYYQDGNYLYKVTYTNLKNVKKVNVSSASGQLRLHFEALDTGNSYYTKLYKAKNDLAYTGDLPKSPGSTLSCLITNEDRASNINKPVVIFTCLAVNAPAWTWNGTSSATAKFTSTDGNAFANVTATISQETVTEATTCQIKEQIKYTASVTFNGQTYTNTKTVTGAAGPHSYINGKCEHCGYECPHNSFTDGKCNVCGVQHTHDYIYTANGNLITATCSNADGVCSDTNGGTLTISAPADLYADGTSSREAIIDNQLVKATDYTVSYSTADGSAPKTAGTYTASVTIGGATASVEFTLSNYAAKVTDKDGNLIGNYKTLADAVTAAQENENSTLTLLNDITLSSVQYIDAGKFTLDLNGKTLSSESSFALRIQSDADITVKDSGEGGTVESKAAGASAVINYGGLTVESGTMKGDGGINNRGTLIFNGGTAEGVTYSAIENRGVGYVYDGVIKSEKTAGITNGSGKTLYVYDGEISGHSGIANSGAAFLYGGEFKGNSYAAINLISGTVEITGGSFTGTDDEYGSLSGTSYGELTVDYMEGATFTLKGGEFPNGFTVYGTTANALLTEGYAFYNKDGNKITVADDAKKIDGYVQVKDHYIARVTDKDGNLIDSYKTIEDAISAASDNNGSTLVLLDDITVTKEQEIKSGKFTLDLNGKTLLNEIGGVLYIWSDADLTIEDSSEGGTIESQHDACYSIFNEGKLTVESGIVKGDGGIDNRGTLIFNGGTVESVTYEAISNGGTAGIYGGNLKSEKSAGIENKDSATFNIYGGEIDGITNFGTAYISGGEIDCDNYAALNLFEGTVEIMGGSFSGTDLDNGYFSGTPYGEWTVDYTEGATLTLKGGEFPGGFTVYGTTANVFLADGYYFRDADGKIITVAENSTGIDGYVKVTKGADFSVDAVVTAEDVVYNGAAQEPNVTVTVGGKILTEGKDYTLVFANNVNAGTATVTVTGAGDYEGKIVKTFEIKKADSSIDVYPEANELTYNGEAQALVTAGSAVNGTMVYSLDGAEYSVSVPTGTNAGEYTVYYKVEGDSNHNDTEPETLTVTIGKKSVTASATVPDRIYGDDYNADTSKVVLTFDGIIDGDDVGYVVTDATYYVHTVTDNAPVQVIYNVNGADAGNYQFPEYGDWMAPNYPVEATGKVLPRDIAEAEIILGDALVYNGTEQTQSIASVTVIGKEVTYTVNGNTATNVGVYELTITGNGNFTGTKTALFEVAPDTTSIDDLTVDNVKSSDKEAIEAVVNQIENADTENVDEDKIGEYNQITEKCNELLAKITETEEKLEEIKGIENNFNPETVSSDDKAAIEEKIAEIENVNPDNLTEEQKAEYGEIKAGFEALLEEIEKAGSEVDAIGSELEMFDEERVTIFYEDEIEALKAKIDELLADENMGEAEKAKLNEYKTQCDEIIEIINTPAKYFSMRLFHFVWDALHWLSSHVVFIFNWIVSMF